MTTAPLCVPVCAARLDELDAQIERAAKLADVIELRLDCLDDEELYLLRHDGGAHLARTLLDHPRDFILTLRPAKEGGRGRVNFGDRFAFWNYGTRKLFDEGGAPNVRCDIELALLEYSGFVRALQDQSFDWQRIICSYHNFDCVPADLEHIYERATQTMAGAIKIAVAARDATDCIPVFKLLARARAESRDLIALAMNTSGLPTRILAHAHGASLAYAALDEGGATAPGQLTAAELRDLYRFEQISERTLLTGLVGAPVAHSLSPQMHNRAFAHAQVDAVYIPLEVHDLDSFIRRMVRPATREVAFNWRGFSVTAPHKEKIIPHLDWLDDASREIGAVNTVVVEGDTLRGYNTDAAALLTPIEKLIDISGARVAVIGVGGAARAALWSLRECGARTIVFARDAARARSVAAKFDAAYASLDAARFDGFDLVINATPLGTRKADGTHERETPARREQLRGAKVVYDLVYNPSETRFMREGKAAGCEAVGGLDMLIGQAAAQWKLWMNEDAPAEVMQRAAQEELKL